MSIADAVKERMSNDDVSHHNDEVYSPQRQHNTSIHRVIPYEIVNKKDEKEKREKITKKMNLEVKNKEPMKKIVCDDAVLLSRIAALAIMRFIATDGVVCLSVYLSVGVFV